MPVKHLIFDLYGTLADADKAQLIVERAELLAFGRDTWMVSDEPEEDFFARFCKAKHLDKRALVESFADMERTTAFFDGIPDLLVGLHDAGYSLNLLSNCGRSVQHFLEEEQDIFCLFNTLTFSYEVGCVKPDEAMFRRVLEKLDAAADECCMIGDHLDSDIRPAEGLGMHAIHFEGRSTSPATLRRHLRKL